MRPMMLGDHVSEHLQSLTGCTGTYKFVNQFMLVLIATPLPRRLDGKISEGMAQGTGPHDAPKDTM